MEATQIHFPDTGTLNLEPYRWRQALWGEDSKRRIEIRAKTTFRTFSGSQFVVSGGLDLSLVDVLIFVDEDDSTDKVCGTLELVTDPQPPSLVARLNLGASAFDLLWSRLYEHPERTLRVSFLVREVVRSGAGDITWVAQKVNPIPIQRAAFEFPCNWDVQQSPTERIDDMKAW